MRKLIALLDPTLTVPVLTTVDAPLGPVTVQPTELICSPPGSVELHADGSGIVDGWLASHGLGSSRTCGARG